MKTSVWDMLNLRCLEHTDCSVQEACKVAASEAKRYRVGGYVVILLKNNREDMS